MRLVYMLTLSLISISSWGQTPRSVSPVPIPQDDFISNRPSTAPTSAAGKEYRIGRDDLIEVTVFEVSELSSTGRVTASGTISMPLIGPIGVAGRTPEEVEQTIEEALRENYINDPHVTVFIREYASQPVSVIGAVKLPGIYQIKGQKFLLDMLAMAQGVDAGAGNVIQVIRAASAAPTDDAAQESLPRQTLTINVEDLFENGKTELNVPIFAGDVINILRAGSVFVVGEVIRPNEFVLRNGKNITVTQAIALANGFTREAQRKQCVIIRYHRDGTKEEIQANTEKILRGDDIDVPMMPNDILFVPANRIKTNLTRALDSAISVVSGRLIYGFR
jgi:polysaccharide biosynthesis/export protein